MDFTNFDDWFANKVHCRPFPFLKTIKENRKIMDVVINCFGTNHYLFHKREYKLDVIRELSERKELLGGKGGYFMLPIQRGNSLENLCRAVHIGLEAYRNNLNLYLHCRSGLHRSEMVRCGIYFHVKGVHLSEAGKFNMLIENVKDKHNMFPVSKDELERTLSQLKTDKDYV